LNTIDGVELLGGAISSLTELDTSGDFSLNGQIVSAETDAPPAPGVPEPSTWAMLLIGFAGIGFAYRLSRLSTHPDIFR
jgi:hypothetical protein